MTLAIFTHSAVILRLLSLSHQLLSTRLILYWSLYFNREECSLFPCFHCHGDVAANSTHITSDVQRAASTPSDKTTHVCVISLPLSVFHHGHICP